MAVSNSDALLTVIVIHPLRGCFNPERLVDTVNVLPGGHIFLVILEEFSV